MASNHPPLTPSGRPSPGSVAGHFNIAGGLLLLLGTLLAGLFLTGFVTAGVDVMIPGHTRTALLVTSATQAVLAFILPAVVSWRIMGTKPLQALCADKGFSLSALAGIILIYFASVPAMDQIVCWNEHISFGGALSGLEETLRKMEEMNGAVGETLMETTSIGGLVSGIAVIGILTGIAEEFFFRGGMQRMLTLNGVNRHIAVWVTAFVFSAIHFQFFGFFPRLLMGAWFGYILLWTRSVWASATAHALNNSMVVVITWMSLRGLLPEGIRESGFASEGFPWLCIASAIVTTLLIAFGKFFKTRNHAND
ncbi:MAG: CPBP family intramembrane metalloprotease [Muribaculaceae bacterium]|nr:CPBP family intramembrane metalloprotease [Muribaculaceae bacterium]